MILEISELGSSRSPILIASVGHTIWHDGSRFISMRWLHMLHLCAVLVSGLMYSASYGQAFMHDLHPMQLSSWKSTTPFSAR